MKIDSRISFRFLYWRKKSIVQIPEIKKKGRKLRIDLSNKP